MKNVQVIDILAGTFGKYRYCEIYHGQAEVQWLSNVDQKVQTVHYNSTNSDIKVQEVM